MSRPQVALALCLRSQPEQHLVRAAAWLPCAALRNFLLYCACTCCFYPRHTSTPAHGQPRLAAFTRKGAPRLSCFQLQPISYIKSSPVLSRVHAPYKFVVLSRAARQAAGRPASGGQPLQGLMCLPCTVRKAAPASRPMRRVLGCAARGQLTALQWEGDTCDGCSGASSSECVQTAGSQPQSSCSGARWVMHRQTSNLCCSCQVMPA